MVNVQHVEREKKNNQKEQEINTWQTRRMNSDEKNVYTQLSTQIYSWKHFNYKIPVLGISLEVIVPFVSSFNIKKINAK